MTDAKLTRREAFIAAGAGAAALSLGTTAQAAAPMQGAHVPEIYRFKLGKFEVTTILDGAVVFPGPHPIFGQNTTADEVQALAKKNFLPGGKMEIGFTQTVVNTSTTSPSRRYFGGSKRAPAPLGVPVAMMSPGFR